MLLTFIIVVIFAGTMLTAAAKDATSMTIPNWISLAVMAGFFIVTPFVWQGLDSFVTHILVGLSFFAAGFAMFAFGWLGGGDAKLMAATALWWQWDEAVIYIFYTTMIGAVFALLLLFGRKYIPTRVLTADWALHLFRDETKMPYGLALAAGALLTLPKSTIFLTSLGL
jgi:prepilin peptidase CpaA